MKSWIDEATDIIGMRKPNIPVRYWLDTRDAIATALSAVDAAAYERGKMDERERCLKIVDAHCPVAQDMEYEPIQSLCANIENIIRKAHHDRPY